MPSTEDDFSAFVATFSGALFRTAYFLTAGDRQSAQDLVKDSLVDSYTRWGTIRDAHAKHAFVRRVMVRKATHRWHRPHKAEFPTAQPPETVVPGHEDSVTSSLDLATALLGLSPQQRAVIVLRYYLDLSEADITAALGCSTGTVKTHASRALKALGVTLDTRTDTTTPAPTLPEIP